MENSVRGLQGLADLECAIRGDTTCIHFSFIRFFKQLLLTTVKKTRKTIINKNLR